MRLSAAVRLSDGEIVAFVGGGGKTTAMFRLADEIVQAGGRVIVTTTTRIFAAQTSLAPRHLSAFEADRVQVEAALNRHGQVLLTGPVDAAANKASGVSPGLIEDLRAVPDLTAILVEADGSRMRPFKAPAAHEPVIPTVTTLVVPVIGVDALGQPLAEARVHRPDLVRALAGAVDGQTITPELVAKVIGHPQGGLKGVPPEARVIALVNKVESADALGVARETADCLLRVDEISSVVIGAVRRAADPAQEVHGRVAAVILAAGRSTRMGQLKQLLPWGSGRTMIAEVVQRLQMSGVHEIVVVTGAAREEVEAAVASTGVRVRFAFNPEFESSEMARSLQVGLDALPGNISAVLVALADQPQTEPWVVRAVIERWRQTLAPVVAPFFQDRRGHPLLFDCAMWPDLLKLPGSANPREFVRTAPRIERVEVETDSVLRDIDTPEDYGRERGA